MKPHWVRFSDDRFESLTELESLWKEAIGQISRSQAEDRAHFQLRDGIAHFDLANLIHGVSQGALRLDGLRLVWAGGRLQGIAALAALQWKIERALTPTAVDGRAARVRSLTLGICQQLLLMRLPAHDERKLARWLADPESAPSIARGSLGKILKIQSERNLLSRHWDGFAAGELPPDANTASTASSSTHWTGLPVSPGQLEGEALLIADPRGEADSSRHKNKILIFLRAHPDSIRYFEQARAVLYAEGGVLSHACSIARERAVPCITGLGRDFAARARTGANLRLRIDCSEGKVILL